MSPRRCPPHTTGGNYGSRRTSLAARRSNPDHHSALSLLALSHAAYADRTAETTKSQNDESKSAASPKSLAAHDARFRV